MGQEENLAVLDIRMPLDRHGKPRCVNAIRINGMVLEGCFEFSLNVRGGEPVKYHVGLYDRGLSLLLRQKSAGEDTA